MKPPAKLHKIISILMSFLILTEFSGCYTQRILTTSEITPTSHILIHNKEQIYSAYKTTIEDGILSGYLDFNSKDISNSNYIDIYLLSDSLFKYNNDQFSLPVNSIKQVNQRVKDPKKTKLLVITLVVVASVGALAGMAISLAHALEPPTPPDGQDWCTYLESIEACSDGSPD